MAIGYTYYENNYCQIIFTDVTLSTQATRQERTLLTQSDHILTVYTRRAKKVAPVPHQCLIFI